MIHETHSDRAVRLTHLAGRPASSQALFRLRARRADTTISSTASTLADFFTASGTGSSAFTPYGVASAYSSSCSGAGRAGAATFCAACPWGAAKSCLQFGHFTVFPAAVGGRPSGLEQWGHATRIMSHSRTVDTLVIV